MALVLLGALLVGVTEDPSPRTEADRVKAIASELQCPTCQGLSAAESDAPAAQAVREEIRDRLREGQSRGEIQRYFVSRFGTGILLKPEATGVASLVWVLPVAGGIAAVVALALTFRRWRREQDDAPAPSEDDRALVERVLRSS